MDFAETCAWDLGSLLAVRSSFLNQTLGIGSAGLREEKSAIQALEPHFGHLIMADIRDNFRVHFTKDSACPIFVARL